MTIDHHPPQLIFVPCPSAGSPSARLAPPVHLTAGLGRVTAAIPQYAASDREQSTRPKKSLRLLSSGYGLVCTITIKPGEGE